MNQLCSDDKKTEDLKNKFKDSQRTKCSSTGHCGLDSTSQLSINAQWLFSGKIPRYWIMELYIQTPQTGASSNFIVKRDGNA